MINIEQIPKSELRNLARELLLAVERADQAEAKASAESDKKGAVSK